MRDGNYVSLFPRTRRFGKSLFISMLDNFFNIEYKDKNKNLFYGLNISKSEYYSYLSSKPVIKLDFKELKKITYEDLYASFKIMIRNIYLEKYYIYDSLNEVEKSIFNNFLYERASDADYRISIKMLSIFMYKYYNKKVVILVDEYDVPIERGYINNYYDNVVSLIKDVLSSALKGNNNITFAVMTGVLRVSKESLFSDLNNVDVYNMIDKDYNEYFGFTEKETNELLDYYGLNLNDDVKNMYDGYNFGGIEIYNPWSILKYAERKELIIKVIKNCEPDIKVKIEKILLGETIEFIYNDKTKIADYNDLNDSDSIFNLLLASGYLTIEKRINKNFNVERSYVKLPNREVRYLFSEILLKILTEGYRIDLKNVNDFCDGIFENDKETVERGLNKMLPKLSYHDLDEK